tara:strand:+ start:695 stop:1087 length:393 start_codon:yes stop_codon:yes gene_type:complete
MKDDQWVDSILGATTMKDYHKVDSVGERIEFIRKYKNLMKSQFAKSVGITPQGYHSMVTGNNCNMPTALAIEYIHGFSAMWIVNGEGDMLIDTHENMRGEAMEEVVQDLIHFIKTKASVQVWPIKTEPSA